MDTKHEALLQHFIHRRLQELVSPAHTFSTGLPQPNFMSPSTILPHLYSSMFVGGATEEMATDLTCRRIDYSDTSQTRLPATTASTPGILSVNTREPSRNSMSKSSIYKESSCINNASASTSSDYATCSNNAMRWQQSTSTTTTSLAQQEHSTNGVPAPPGSHTMISAPSMAAAPSPFRSPGNGGGAGGGMLRTSPWPATAHAPDGFGRFTVGGSVYSLFPSLPSATEANAIYSQASNSPGAARFGGQTTATTFHSFLSAQKGDTLFSSGFPLTPNSMPSNSPQQQHQLFGASTAGLSPGLSPVTAHLTPLEAERGLSQLELMARGFTNIRRNDEVITKDERKPERRSRQTTKEKRQCKKIRNNNNNNNSVTNWSENDKKNNNNKTTWSNNNNIINDGSRLQTDINTTTSATVSGAVKTEAVRTTCGCANVRSVTSSAVNASSTLTITTSSPSFPQHHPLSPTQLAAMRCNTDIINIPIFHPPLASPMQAAPMSPASHAAAVDLCRSRGESETRQNGGCSRTIPLPPRSRSSDTPSTNHNNNNNNKPSSPINNTFTPNVIIKKEIGTPCQVAEITTSRSTVAPCSPVLNQGTKVANNNNNISIPITSSTTSTCNILPVHTIKTEPICESVNNDSSSLVRKDIVTSICNNNNEAVTFTTTTSVPQISTSTASGIPVGIAVARQRPSEMSMRPEEMTSKPQRCAPVLAPAPATDKPRDDFRVMLPSRGRSGPNTVSSACVLTSVSTPVTVQTACSSGVTMHHHEQQQRTTTLTIPASSIVLQQRSPNTGVVGGCNTHTTNTATLQVQTTGGSNGNTTTTALTSCDEATAVALATRLTNGIQPWAGHTTHNSALTPPTLWLGQPQYPTGPTVPVQLEAAPPALPPLPPVGLQLVRDPISGHLLLLPAASLEHLQRAAAVQVWPSNTSTFQTGTTSQHHLPQLMLHQAAPQPPPPPQTQHITLFQQAPSNSTQQSSSAPQASETEYRILIPPQHNGQPTQLALLHEAVKSKKPGDMLDHPKLEILDTMAKLLPDINAPATPNSFPTSFVFPAPQTAPQPPPAQQPPQLQYFYEQLTGVQIAPQTPIAAVAPPVLETGRRSQGTSPANPAEGCLTPPPESSSPAAAACAERAVMSAEPVPEEAAQENTADSCAPCAPEVAPEEPVVLPTPGEVTVQDASNQTETPPVSEDENTRDANTEAEEEEVNVTAQICEPVLIPPVDVSGLELLSNSIEQFTQREKEAEESSKINNNETLIIPPTPLPVEQQIISIQPPPVTEMVGGLGLLCALAEQRFMEDIVSNETEETKEVVLKPKETTPTNDKVITKERIDINRNYKSPKSEREIKKFIASKVSQYQEQSSSHSSNSDSTSTDFMDAMELDMRMRLAELQRRYKEKQKELSKLQHSRRSNASDDGSNSPGKRGPGRPRKRKLSTISSSPLSPRSRNKTSKERSPPVVDKLSTDISSTNGGCNEDENNTPKLKSTKDILKPPTLTANKILTSAKFKPNTATVNLSNKFKLPTCNVNIVKLKTVPGKIKTSKQVEEIQPEKHDNVGTLSSPGAATDEASSTSTWLTGGFFRRTGTTPTTARKSSSPLSSTPRTQQPLSGYTFGSKQLTPSLLSGGEKQRLESLTSDSLFWFLKPDKSKDTPTKHGDSPAHQFGELPTPGGQKRKLGSASEPESDPENSTTPSLFAVPTTSSTGSSSSSCSSCSSSSSSSKKRKPGRPKRRAPSRQDEEATETIVAKKPKSISFLLSPPPFAAPPSLTSTPTTSSLGALHKPKIKPKLKAEAKVKSSLSCDDEEDSWPRRTIETDTKIDAWNNKDDSVEKPPKHGLDAATRLGGLKKRPVNAVVPAKVRCPSGGSKQRSNSNESRQKKVVATEKITSSRDVVTSKKQQDRSSPVPEAVPDIAGSDSDDGKARTASNDVSNPERPISNGIPPSCALTQEDLEGEPRALAVMGGLVYAGHVTAIRAPDVYGITLDGERGNRPHIFCREEMLKEAIREVKPRCTSDIPPGTRICAYWSQQYRCLYPGTVAAPTSPDPERDLSFVNVEFDDGDSGRIHLEDIRMLPVNFPIVEYDPNPLMSLAKRRRRASGASSTEGRRTSSETALNVHDDLPAPTPSPTPLHEANIIESKPEETKKDTTVESKKSETAVVASKVLDDEERERRKQKKREKAKKKEKLRKLLARSVAALGKLPNRKKHKKHRCDDRHHHKHHHRRRKHRHHRHDKSRSTENSSSPASSSPAPEPSTPELPQPVPEVVPEVVPEIVPEVVKPPPTTKKAKVSGRAAQHSADPPADPSPPTPQNELKAKKRQERQSSAESVSKMAAFLPARQLWRWAGKGYKRPGAKGRGKKEFFKSIQRGKENINVGDCAVFLSTGRPDRPYIGRIETMWESWGGNMVVRVKWFYHPEETQGGEGIDKLKYPGALFQSPHADENDVQTISHRCEVLALSEYTRRLGKEPSRYTTIYDNNDIYYLAGSYDPTAGVLTMEPGVTSP